MYTGYLNRPANGKQRPLSTAKIFWRAANRSNWSAR